VTAGRWRRPGNREESGFYTHRERDKERRRHKKEKERERDVVLRQCFLLFCSAWLIQSVSRQGQDREQQMYLLDCPVHRSRETTRSTRRQRRDSLVAVRFYFPTDI